MTPTIMAVLGIIASNSIAIWLALRSDRKTRQRQMEDLIQNLITDKLDGILTALSSHEKRISEGEKNYERLMGRLEGKGCLPSEELVNGRCAA